MLAMDCLEVLSEVLERFALAHWGFVVDGLNAPDEFIVEFGHPDFDAGLLGLPDHVAGLVIYLLFPPMLKRAELQHGSMIPFQMELKLGSPVGNLLKKGKEIGFNSRSATQFGEEGTGILYKVIVLVPKPAETKYAVCNRQHLPVNLLEVVH